MKKYIILVSCILAFSSCKNHETSAEKKPINPANTDSLSDNNVVKLNYFYNDIAHFIAGMKVSDSCLFLSETEKKEWKDYSVEMDTNWNKFQTEKIDLMKPWVDKELSTINSTTKNVFYPFSGPDFAYIETFHPNADNYYLLALEPVGIIPDINKIGNSMPSFFSTLNAAIRDNLSLSFFITKFMKDKLNNEQISGALPVLLFFMARMDMHIQNISPATITKEGKLVTTEDQVLNKIDKKITNGVEICFIKPGEKKLRKLYYLSTNIHNNGFVACPELGLFLESLPKDLTTFVKSSSYCMHSNEFDKIRNVILTHSKYLLQDDTGIPFKIIKESQLGYKFYGVYTRPIPVFSYTYQSDLDSIVPKNNPKLPFRFGYNKDPYILLAQKK